MKKETVSSSFRGNRFKRVILFSNVFFTGAIALLVYSFGTSYFENVRYQEIYNSLALSFIDVNEIEYGNVDITALDFVDKVENGEITSYPEDLDLTTVGLKEYKYEISKNDVVKEYILKFEVKDTILPVITLKNKTVTVYNGNKYDLNSNIVSVTDEIDGDLKYVDSIPEECDYGYYTITSDFNNKKNGNYNVTIKAIDKNGNEVEETYTIKVVSKPVKKTLAYSYTGPSSVDTSSVVNAAKSLVGSKYKYATANPSIGFDCSGLVSYVYGLFGVKLPRTVSGLYYSGHAVSESDMAPGDIIVWSDRSDNVPTHVSLYIGDGQMVHAANGRKGVIISTIVGWKNGNRNKIVSVRRV